MAKDFSPEDFEPIYQQAIILTIAIQEHPDSSLTILGPELTSIHTQLSTLVFKASNPNSLLRKRCSDRHGEWLQIRYDLQQTLCEAQDLAGSLSKSDVLEIGHPGLGLEKIEEELSVHAFLIGQFIESLGLSKVARKEPSLGEAETILMDAAREEREKLGRERLAALPDVSRLGGWHRILRLLEENGIDRSEIVRLDTKIKQVLVWVLRNEEDITMVKDLEGFGDVGKKEHGVGQLQDAPREQEEEIKYGHSNELKEEQEEEGHDEEFQEVYGDGHEGQASTESYTDVPTTQKNDDDNNSVDSYVWV